MHIYTGNHPWLAPGSPMEKFVLGNVYGHEVAGVVDAVGDGVTAVAVGQRVALDAIVPCQRCEYCRVGQYQICSNLEHYGFHIPGGFAEYILVPEANAFPLADTVSFEQGALLDVLVVGIPAVHIAGITMSDRVTILGAGPIGLGMAAAAVRAGARETYITTEFPLQRDVAGVIGIDHLLDYREDVTGAMMELTDGLGVDCVLESVGYKAKTIQQGIAIIRKGGRIIFTGVFEEPVTLNFGDLLGKEATISASHAFGIWGLVPEFRLAAEMMARGEFPADRIVTHRFPLDQVNEAFQVKLDHPESALKVQIVFPE